MVETPQFKYLIKSLSLKCKYIDLHYLITLVIHPSSNTFSDCLYSRVRHRNYNSVRLIAHVWEHFTADDVPLSCEEQQSLTYYSIVICSE